MILVIKNNVIVIKFKKHDKSTPFYYGSFITPWISVFNFFHRLFFSRYPLNVNRRYSDLNFPDATFSVFSLLILQISFKLAHEQPKI